MKKQIVRISILQSSKVATLLYALLGFIYTLVGIPMAAFGHGPFRVMGIIYIFGPIFMGIAGFIFFALAAALYNFAASFVGGFEMEVKDVID